MKAKIIFLFERIFQNPILIIPFYRLRIFIQYEENELNNIMPLPEFPLWHNAREITHSILHFLFGVVITFFTILLIILYVPTDNEKLRLDLLREYIQGLQNTTGNPKHVL